MAKKKNTQNIEEDIFSHIENNKNINPDIQGCVQKKSKSYRFTSDEESWNKKINKIIEIAENQRRWPSLSSGNEEEKKLAKLVQSIMPAKKQKTQLLIECLQNMLYK